VLPLQELTGHPPAPGILSPPKIAVKAARYARVAPRWRCALALSAIFTGKVAASIRRTARSKGA
jgi:hypothetical protein